MYRQVLAIRIVRTAVTAVGHAVTIPVAVVAIGDAITIAVPVAAAVIPAVATLLPHGLAVHIAGA